MLKKIALGLLALVVVILLVGALLPRQWNVEEAVVVAATPEQIYPHLEDLSKWQAWVHEDPSAASAYNQVGPPRSGKGATWSWNGKDGRGTLTLTDVNPALGVTFDEKIESDEVNAHGSITFAQEGGATKVTWKDEGTLPPVVGGLFRGMVEKALSDHYAKSLRRLKSIAEASPPPAEAIVADAAVVDAAVVAGAKAAVDGGTDGGR